jgi:glycosyltransferase involved in cell wall biosynthesis
MKVKILFLISTLEKAGPTNVMFNIVKYLDRNKVVPVILTLSSEPSVSRKKDFEDLGVEVFTYKKSRLYWLFSGLQSFRDLVDQIGPHIIHSHSLRADISSDKHLRRYYRISTVHGDLYANYKDRYNMLLGWFFSKRQVDSIARLELAVACSKSVEELYKKKISRLTCIQNGVDDDQFAPVDGKVMLRQRLGLPSDRCLYISIGSLIKRKDPETIIKAFLQRDTFKPASLVFVGTGDLEHTLRQQYGAYPEIIFKGFVNNVSEYLQASDFFISASVSEGLPNTVLEALGCGVPVLLSDIPSHQEILTINSDAGALFRCADINGLSHAMNQLSERNSSLMREAALHIVHDKLNARSMARQYQAIYLQQNQQEWTNKIILNT